MAVTACFDAFIEDATDIAACERCGLDLVASQEISDCGRDRDARGPEPRSSPSEPDAAVDARRASR